MDVETKRKTLRLFSNGMYIMTSRDGDHYGAATVTWLSQASFKPPLIMAALRTESNVFKCLSQSRLAAIHILSADQQELARKFFATTRVSISMINGEPFVDGKTSAPILQSVPNYIECRVHQILDIGGDHALVILEPVEAEYGREMRPLTVAESPWEYGG